MKGDGRSCLVATLASVATLPGLAAAQSVDPSVVTETSPLIRVAGSFVLVALFGWGVLSVAEEFVDHSVDASMESPLRSIVYGLAAQVVVVFFGFYAASQLAGVSESAVDAVLVALGVLVMALEGLGFAVVGARLTETADRRRLPLGVVVGASVSALVWVIPTFTVALLAWLLVASVGIGGPTEEWLHASKDGGLDA